jgi:hypothetical protein
MPSVLTPLQLTAAASLLSNTGLKGFPTALKTAIDTFNATTVINNFILAVNFYKTQSFATSATLTSLLSIGSTVCPALGNSIPASPVGTYTYLNDEYLINYLGTVDGSTIDPSGFSNLIEQTCAAYLGNGDYGRFSQGFMAVQNYISITNSYINSAVNANQFLGPTFSNMDNLTTAGVAGANTDLNNFGTDLAKQGNLWDPKKLDLYGTPAGLVQQVSKLAGVRDKTVPGLQGALISVGLNDVDVVNLVNDNRIGLFNPNGLTQNEFDRTQRLAYQALTTVSGDPLTQILDILDVTTPNINSLDELLDPTKVFPLSYSTMQTPTPNGYVNIFDSNGAVRSEIAPVVNSYLPTASGCDELGKIIPPADAVANKAIQVALQQINNIANTTLPDLAELIVGTVDNPWDDTQEYLADDVVSVQLDSPVPAFYRAASPGCTPSTFTVPPGTDINNTDYWQPTTLGGLETMADLPLIQAQTTAVDSSVSSYIATQVATGTGPCGVLTTYDVLGLALDSNNFAAQLNTATAAINALQAAGSLAALNTAYSNILLAANNAAVITLIGNANAAIAALSASPYVTTLNTAWAYMANLMNLSAKYTSQSGIDYFLLQPGDTNSTKSFVQNLPQYGLLTANGDAVEFLENLADTTTLGGQAVVGAMREGRNTQRLNAAGLYNSNQIPSNPVVAPIPVILPAN